MVSIFSLFVIIFIGLLYSLNLNPLYLISALPKRSVPDWVMQTPVAHRGLHDHKNNIPENSLKAFQSAIDKGLAIELDVHITKDLVPIVMHDFNTKKMTGEDYDIASTSYNELSSVTLMNTEEKIPTLKEALELIKGQVPIYVEVKNKSFRAGDLEKYTYEALKSYEGAYAVISFCPQTLGWFRENAPDVLVGQTSCGFDNKKSSELNSVRAFVLQNYLLNFISKPDFLIYAYQDMDKSTGLNFLKKQHIVVTYGANSKASVNVAKGLSENFMFDYFESLS